MFRAYDPFLISFSKEAQEMLGCPPAVAAVTALHDIAVLAGSFDIARAPVTIADASCVASVQVMASDTIVIKADSVPNGLSPCAITGTAWHEALNVRATGYGRLAR